MLVHLKRHLSLLSLKFACLQPIVPSSMFMWCLSHSSKPAITMPSARPNTCNMSLNNSSIICWNMSPVGTVPKGSIMYQDLPNGQEKGVKYDYFSSSSRLS